MLIIDHTGRIIKSSEITEKKTPVDLSAEPKGIYFLKIISTEGIIIQKIIVESLTDSLFRLNKTFINRS